MGSVVTKDQKKYIYKLHYSEVVGALISALNTKLLTGMHSLPRIQHINPFCKQLEASHQYKELVARMSNVIKRQWLEHLSDHKICT